MTIEDGDRFWRLNGDLHKDAAVCTDFYVSKWCRLGVLHREDGPAVEAVDGFREWYLYGERHRENGPAVEFASGNKIWYKHGYSVDELVGSIN